MAYTHPSIDRPRDQSAANAGVGPAPFFRSLLDLSTWLLIGASAQAIITLLPLSKRYVILPPLALLSYRILSTIIAASTYKPGQNGEILHKVTTDFSRDPASDGSVCVLLLGFKINHPLGLLAPGTKQIAAYAQKMNEDLCTNAVKFNYLGSSRWINANDGSSCHEIMTLFYFRKREDVLHFANSESHREGWAWWNKDLAKLGHLGISHEVFEAPMGSWEGIYVNYRPSGICATTFKAVDEASGEERWMSPLQDASKGRYRTHEGRVGLGNGAEHDKYADTPRQ